MYNVSLLSGTPLFLRELERSRGLETGRVDYLFRTMKRGTEGAGAVKSGKNATLSSPSRSGTRERRP